MPCAVLLLILSLCALLSSASRPVGGAIRVTPANTYARMIGYALNYCVSNSSFVDTFQLLSYNCSVGQFLIAPPPIMTPRCGGPLQRYSFTSDGWLMQAYIYSNGTAVLSCSVTYVGSESNFAVRFAHMATYLATGGGSECWAVWQPDGSDITYPIATSWIEYLVAPSPQQLTFLTYNVTLGSPVAQGVICPGN